jgi:MFS family permease
MQEKVQELHDHRWLIFSVVALGTFVSTLTSSIVNVALPLITLSLKSDITTAQWVVTAYLLVITSLLPLLGRLGDVWGHRRVYGIGFAGYILGSLLCSISFSMGMLIFSRLIQAIGAYALMSNSMAVVTRNFPAHDRGKALGMIGTVVALGTLTGPSLGEWQTRFRATS